MALTIAGSDSGGGAGIAADLKTFAALGVHGACAITCVTAQNPDRVAAVQACRPAMVRAQILVVAEALAPAAVKTGMLHSAALVRAVVAALADALPGTPLVVDPVMVATSGARLLAAAGIRELQRHLLPRATLVTPNLDEVAVLLGRRPETLEDMRAAARGLHGRYGCAALVKGGHLPGGREAADIFFDGREELLLTAPMIPGLRTHGTGCTYAAAITAGLAAGCDLPTAVTRAKSFMAGALAHGYVTGEHFHLRQVVSGGRSGRPRAAAE